MNARTQITMDPEMPRRAHARAAELGHLVCRIHPAGRCERPRGAKPKVDGSVIFDLGASDAPTDIARDKHKMIGEALWEDHLRSVGGGFEETPPRRKSRIP